MDTQANQRKRLVELLINMDVPVFRINQAGGPDLHWLNRNLGINNREHKDFAEAFELVRTLIKS